ncbi:hypothetical protein BVC71_09590 [Marivivens niveibacter]|uniref:Uncharacterized protein n=1 Tax=Marivivens niveibacter TaxID=1930667 RepID=A0A251WX02_9RHOB|nr:hypothetical protein [Marivivens niveibacter]OUD08957.1 hypothetical protein BVC71_09590 [Marivivens niveibacter]
MAHRATRFVIALAGLAALSACMDNEGNPATQPPPESSRATEAGLYNSLCVTAASSGDFSLLPEKFQRLGYSPTTSVSLNGGRNALVQRWEQPGSDILLFSGDTEQKADFCAVAFPGKNPVTGINAPVAEAALWYNTTLAALGRSKPGLISSSSISVAGVNGATSRLSYELAQGGLAVYAANF